MIIPEILRQRLRDILYLFPDVASVRHVKALPQSGADNGFMFLFIELPEIYITGHSAPASVRHVKNIAQNRVCPASVNQRDPSGSTPHIAAHTAVPDLIFRAGRRVGTLGVDHQLFRERIFVQSRGGRQKIGPFLKTACDPSGDLRRHLLVSFQIIRHSRPPGQKRGTGSPSLLPLPS